MGERERKSPGYHARGITRSRVDDRHLQTVVSPATLGPGGGAASRERDGAARVREEELRRG